VISIKLDSRMGGEVNEAKNGSEIAKNLSGLCWERCLGRGWSFSGLSSAGHGKRGSWGLSGGFIRGKGDGSCLGLLNELRGHPWGRKERNVSLIARERIQGGAWERGGREVAKVKASRPETHSPPRGGQWAAKGNQRRR